MGKEEEQKFTCMDSRNNVCMLCSCSSILPGILTLKYFIVLNHALPGMHHVMFCQLISWFSDFIFPQEVIDVLKQPVLLPQWDPQIKSLKILSAASNRDVISLSFNCSNVFVKTVQYIRDFFGQEVNAVFSR